MDWVLALSLVLQIIAAVWSGALAWRSRDWRLAMLTILLALMAARRGLGMFESSAARSLDEAGAGAHSAIQFIVLIISVLSVGAIASLHHLLMSRSRGDAGMRLLAAALSDASAPVLILEAGEGPGDPRIVFVSDTICALSGYLREEMLGRTPRMFEGPETCVDFTSAARRCLERQERVVIEAVKYRKDRVPYWAQCALSPVRGSGGRATHLLWFQTDISERKRAESDLRSAMQKLSFHVDNSPLAVIEWDRDFRVAAWSSGAARIFGWSAQEVLGKHPREWPIVHPDDAESVARVIERLHRGEEARNLCVNRNTTKSGEVIWCQWYNSVLFEADGRVNSVLSLAQDVTERHRADERQRLLMLELDHRVKNNLTMVLGIAQQSIAASRSLDGFAASFVGRVEALARAHGLLAKASWDGVNLRALCEKILESGLVSVPPQVRLSGPDVSLSASQGSILALTLHELMTNALKYGAMSATGGTVDVSWGCSDSGEIPILSLEWREQGGPRVMPPARSGFGTEFIETGIAYELHGSASIDYDVGGVRCAIRIPLEPLNRAGGGSTRRSPVGIAR